MDKCHPLLSFKAEQGVAILWGPLGTLFQIKLLLLFLSDRVYRAVLKFGLLYPISLFSRKGFC